MHIVLDLMWLAIWTTALMSSFRLVIRLGMICAAMAGPVDDRKIPTKGALFINTYNLLGTALNWAVIILFYNS